MPVSMLTDWVTTLSLIFGGCCSNAITLEQLTSEFPKAGSLITFFQFLIISIHGLPKHIMWTRYGPRFRPRKIPLTPYLIQVALFYIISLLNNAAFAYRIPMSVHIIFRSGGLVISMTLGWLFRGQKYNTLQILSVFLVTIGVILTTFSASGPSKPHISTSSAPSSHTYMTGIAILSLALLLSGFLGITQDWTYSKYGRPKPTSQPQTKNSTEKNNTEKKKEDPSSTWQESMFYLHFLALPMFISVRADLANQFSAVTNGPWLALPIIPPMISSPIATPGNSTGLESYMWNITLPAATIPLLLNTLTQLVCVAGVNRLTTRVSSLTVTLTLVVRKAVSLILSVLGVGLVNKERNKEVNMGMMWTGAGLVFLGTIAYSIGTGWKKEAEKTKGKKD